MDHCYSSEVTFLVLILFLTKFTQFFVQESIFKNYIIFYDDFSEWSEKDEYILFYYAPVLLTTIFTCCYCMLPSKYYDSFSIVQNKIILFLKLALFKLLNSITYNVSYKITENHQLRFSSVLGFIVVDMNTKLLYIVSSVCF